MEVIIKIDTTIEVDRLVGLSNLLDNIWLYMQNLIFLQALGEVVSR